MFLLQQTGFYRIQSVVGLSIIFRAMLRRWGLMTPLFITIFRLIQITKQSLIATSARAPESIIVGLAASALLTRGTPRLPVAVEQSALQAGEGFAQ
jgi:hypothetical protein